MSRILSNLKILSVPHILASGIKTAGKIQCGTIILFYYTKTQKLLPLVTAHPISRCFLILCSYFIFLPFLTAATYSAWLLLRMMFAVGNRW